MPPEKCLKLDNEVNMFGIKSHIECLSMGGATSSDSISIATHVIIKSIVALKLK